MKAKPQSNNKVTIDRNSKNGQFVTPSYARKHPSTTEKEQYNRKK